MKKIIVLIIPVILMACTNPGLNAANQTGASNNPIPQASQTKPSETNTDKEITPSPVSAKTEENNFDKSNEGIDVNETKFPEATEFTNPNPVYLDVDTEWQEKAKPSYNYTFNEQIPENVTTGIVEFLFKDEYKIRYFGEERLFESLVGQSTSEVNKLIREVIKGSKNDIGSSPNYSKLSLIEQQELEKKYAEKKKWKEDLINKEVPNNLSRHNIYIQGGINLKSFIETLRKLDVVVTANYIDPVVMESDNS